MRVYESYEDSSLTWNPITLHHKILIFQISKQYLPGRREIAPDIFSPIFRCSLPSLKAHARSRSHHPKSPWSFRSCGHFWFCDEAAWCLTSWCLMGKNDDGFPGVDRHKGTSDPSNLPMFINHLPWSKFILRIAAVVSCDWLFDRTSLRIATRLVLVDFPASKHGIFMVSLVIDPILGVLRVVSNVDKTRINHPPNHNLYRGYVDHSLGGINPYEHGFMTIPHCGKTIREERPPIYGLHI